MYLISPYSGRSGQFDFTASNASILSSAVNTPHNSNSVVAHHPNSSSNTSILPLAVLQGALIGDVSSPSMSDDAGDLFSDSLHCLLSPLIPSPSSAVGSQKMGNLQQHYFNSTTTTTTTNNNHNNTKGTYNIHEDASTFTDSTGSHSQTIPSSQASNTVHHQIPPSFVGGSSRLHHQAFSSSSPIVSSSFSSQPLNQSQSFAPQTPSSFHNSNNSNINNNMHHSYYHHGGISSNKVKFDEITLQRDEQSNQNLPVSTSPSMPVYYNNNNHNQNNSSNHNNNAMSLSPTLHNNYNNNTRRRSSSSSHHPLLQQTFVPAVIDTTTNNSLTINPNLPFTPTGNTSAHSPHNLNIDNASQQQQQLNNPPKYSTPSLPPVVNQQQLQSALIPNQLSRFSNSYR
eukprot:GDKJ01046962.1.p1 GENE.GDKJ01046962.1~~GDKJ01046962.1.p1  ORF type:complete len:415 (-),score=138.79 GDKJ01046962.1:3973-5166(-)